VSQNQFLAIPSGWTLAPNSNLTEQAAAANPWGTECLVIRDGSALSTSAGRPCGATAQLVTVNGNTFRPVQSRVFISQIADASPAVSTSPAAVVSAACIMAGVALVYVAQIMV
jgi:hypothetical protein